MRSKRLLMGAAVIGCLAATMTSGAYTQEANTTGQFNARAGRQQPSIGAQPNTSLHHEQFNARAIRGRASSSGQLERRGVADEGRMNGPTRRTLAGERGIGGDRFTYARASAERYGRDRRGERGLYASAGAEGGYRGDRAAYRDRAVGVGVGAVAADYTYPRRLYAYAPTYDVGYAAEPYYSYSPGYEAAVPTGPYYEPDWNVAYAGPSYAYAPGISFGIGIGPVGIGVGPAWGW
jgi:hypothetical protein